mmetsp:Transcript_15529/g.33623  ORF Transcript_15529/g.33623 Transcript_15529/m.33623 type:complete len:214 (+) Transcript_15529:283-924(+)|eukprot:CAMPEP_0172304416 /NCGR_PEP_ID=MMETSP1058-20130122/5838_1 /TAXON_ID=83371 /ORGANISM="Detonula confervacea, Strain CCMP 353" /LENGTH=213 /DNA_ID=CAMNT_0013015643 /DNA_START=266 /DNA_END=907 /DNA_ORIENTATION=+
MEGHRRQESVTSSADERKPPSQNPAVTILRKILFLHPQQKQPVVTVIKDIIAGTIFGVILLMFLIFLDYKNIIRLRSARGLRQAAFEMIADPEMVQSIEEYMDVKFIPMEVYNDMTHELSRHRTAVAEMVKYGISVYEIELEEKRKEVEPLKQEQEEWGAKMDKLAGLDKWCGKCNAGMHNCDVRVTYLKNTYGNTERVAKVNLMNKGKCIQE